MAIGSVFPDTSLVLDTDLLNDWRFGKQLVRNEIAAYISRLKRPPSITAITVFEILGGFEKVAAKSGGLDERTKPDRLKTEQLIEYCGVLAFDHTAAGIAAYIFYRLSQSDRNKHWCDVFITATALAHGHGIATRNQKDFELIANHLPLSHQLLRLAVWKT